MSPAMSALSSIGITHNVMILIVLALVLAAVIGLFWQYIVPGAIIVLVASLFWVTPEVTTTKEATKVDSKNVEVESFDEYQAYMKDCIEVAEYSMFECKKLWDDRGEKHTNAEVDFKPAHDVQLLETDNQEYKARRATAIQKGNAVVMQATYR